ncbi:acyl carrier protein [Pseudomonas sp. RIT-PI-q]|uniref:phosphopantetheine-binding protein n=1 Tax=Pseudomonas sp. RIT-PI-q TaxID=1690247 RepID=UPI0006CE29A2|nr:phosphopantetheine-binding protein [Pseudomonas sp. RIT-PI-q]KPG98634.1 acyl carrier protein [Pseudomonas sp. RIT-PI-q]
MSGRQIVDVEIERQVIRVLSEYFPVGRRKIERGSLLVEDLYVDSISLVEIVMELNEVFCMELPEAGVAKFRTVSDICCLVESNRVTTV